jgi:hypothetical protein
MRHGHASQVSWLRLFVEGNLVNVDRSSPAARLFGDLVAHLLEALGGGLDRLPAMEDGDEEPPPRLEEYAT